MRIVGGEWGGRRLFSPGPGVRPTQDRVRQILFDILGGSITEGPVLDLYAGSGALGLEALSRGAPSAVLVESSRRAATVLRRNCETLNAGERARILLLPVRRALALLGQEGAGFRWVLADPPYGTPEVTEVLGALGNAASSVVIPGGGLVLESRESDRVPDRAGELVRRRCRVAGGTALHFFVRADPPARADGAGKEDSKP